jgi:hypothetical protein
VNSSWAGSSIWIAHLNIDYAARRMASSCSPLRADQAGSKETKYKKEGTYSEVVGHGSTWNDEIWARCVMCGVWKLPTGEFYNGGLKF